MSSDIYSESFFDLTTAGSLQGARRILPLLWRLRRFGSAVDVGCGVGAWLAVAKELGASRLCGIDGPQVPVSQLMVDPDVLERKDLELPLSLAQEYELCLCLEVAEHLHPSRGEGLVLDLGRLSDIVAFSAAIPFQGGDGHLNEMWPEYWARMFAKSGFLPWVGLRRSIWHMRDIPWWYRQNLIIYVRESIWETVLSGEEPARIDELTMIHPESYLWNVRRKRRELATTYDYDLDAYYSCIEGRCDVNRGYGPEFPAPRPAGENQ